MAESKAKQMKIDIDNQKDPAKEKALEDAFKSIEKSYGKGSVMRLGDKAQEKVDVIPTGSIALDVALGVGGYPKGRIIEIYGPESSGKTTSHISFYFCLRNKSGNRVNNNNINRISSY